VRIRNKIHFAVNRQRPSEAEIEREAEDVLEWYAVTFVGAEVDTRLDEWLKKRAEDERERWAPPHVVKMFERAAERARDPQNEILGELRRMQARRAKQRALGRKPANDRPHTQPAPQNRARESRPQPRAAAASSSRSGDDPPDGESDEPPGVEPGPTEHSVGRLGVEERA
jgi:hypothetical protein